MNKETPPIPQPPSGFPLQGSEVLFDDEYDHWGRPLVDHVPDGDNGDRHEDNINRLSRCWYKGKWYE